MKKYFVLICLLISWNYFAVPSSAPTQIPKLDTNCNQAKYFTLGILCQDTDDGKLYKGTGAAVAELAAGSSGDVLADGSVPFTGAPIPSAANTIAMGSPLAEWADAYIGDGGILYGQNDQSNTLISSSTGWRAPLPFSLGTASSVLGQLIFLNNTNANPFTIFPRATSGAGIGWGLPIAQPGGSNYLLNVDADGTMDYTDPATWLTPAQIDTPAELESVTNSGAYASDILGAANKYGLQILIVPADPGADRVLMWDDSETGAEVVWGSASGFSVTTITDATDDTTPATTATAVLAQGGSLVESTLGQIGTAIGVIDWTSDQGATNIHSGNIPDLSGTYSIKTTIPYLVGADIALDATGDTSPPVTGQRRHVITATAAVEIASLTDSSGDYSEFSNGNEVELSCQDDEVSFDFTSNTEFGFDNGGVNFTCSDTIPTTIKFEYDSVNTRWNVISGIPYGYSNPTTANLGSVSISGTDDAISNEDSAGILKTGIGGDTIAIGDVVYLNDADGRWELADNDATADPQANEAKGVAVSTSTDGTAITVLIYGKMRLDSWTWNDNEGQPLYLSATAGDLTETRPTSAIEAPQIVAYIESDDEIFVNPQPIDFSVIRTGTDEDGRTLTCLEATNTWWDGDGTYVTPALSTCPTIDFTASANSAVDLTFDPNAADDTIVNGVTNADGENWSSPDAINDTIKCSKHDADTLRCIVNGTWTAE